MEEKTFRALLDKHAKEKCTDEEEALLYQWYDTFQVTDQTPVADQTEYNHLQQQMLQAILQHTDPLPAIATEGKSSVGWWRSSRVRAACLVVLLAGATLLVYKTGTHRQSASASEAMAWHTIRTRPGERHKVLLPDSSVVYLDGGSELQYPVAFAGRERQVRLLSGEAFLEVQQNRKQPFVVHTGALQVKVLGTSFMVRNRLQDTAVTVAVKTGKVAFSAVRDAALLLTAGDKGVYQKQDGRMLQTSCNTRGISGWINNELVFEDDTLEEITDVLANSYGMQCIITDNALKSKRFKAGFVHRTPADMIRVLSRMGDFHYDIKDSVIRIYP